MLEEIFQELNATHFGAVLPIPKLRWNSRLSSSAGRFCPGSRKFWAESVPEIEVATYLRELPDGPMHIRDTVLHEMIHYYLWHQRRPYGHTAEFHSIMRRVGAKRFNPVPKQRPVKHWYECQHCRKKIPARRKMGVSACAICCERYNRGKYHEKFRLVLVEHFEKTEELIPKREALASEPALSPSEVIRRLEELKNLIRKSSG